MADWYVKGRNGSQSNGGHSLADALQCLPTQAMGVASADRIYVFEQTRHTDGTAATVTYTDLSDVLIWCPNGPSDGQCRGDIEIGTGFAGPTGTKWTKNIGAGLVGGGVSVTLGLLVFQWNGSLSGLRHFGHLRYVAGAGALGQYDYDDGTGVLTINVPSSPNTAADAVVYQNLSTFVGIGFVGGSGNVVDGLGFALYCGNQVYPCRFDHSPYGVCRNCLIEDGGEHGPSVINASGTTGTGCVFQDNIFRGGQHNANPIVFFQFDGTLAEGRVQGGEFHLYRYLGYDGNVRAGQSDNAMIGVYCHGDSGTTIGRILVDGAKFVNYAGEDGGVPVDCANVAAPNDAWKWNNYGVSLDRCVLVDWARWRVSQYLAVRRSMLDFARSGPSALNRYTEEGAIGFGVAQAGKFLLEANAITFNGTDAGENTVNLAIWNTGHDLRLLNNSIYESSAVADAGGIIMASYKNVAGNIRARGNIVGFALSAGTNNIVFYDDAGIAAANHDWLDNAYFMERDAWSGNGAFDTQAEYVVQVDTAGRYLAANPFPNAPTNLGLTTASALWTLRRTTSAITPAAGLNGAYAEFYGAYQYGPFVAQPRLGMSIGVGV